MEKACIWNFKIVNDRKLPKSWDDFCEMFPIKNEEYFVSSASTIANTISRKGGSNERLVDSDSNVLPDRATAEAVLALCQLIQLRNAYNGYWKPDWDDRTDKYFIEFFNNEINKESYCNLTISPLFFKTADLRDKFLLNFRPLIEKIKPLYGINEGGGE